MSIKAPPAAPERKARCRYRDQRENPCPNEALDDDPHAMKICGKHALRAVQLLSEHGVIRYKLGNPAALARRTA